MERVQRKLRRLMAIGAITLGIGLLAVLGAIVYRINAAPARSITLAAMEEASLPAGARLVSTTLDGERMVLGFAVGEETLILMVDARTLRVQGSLRLKAK